ncbi:hypothetical protein IPF37_00295 [bacterium]|nr:MAG: hypothetical protein IPF37_00295 [bacterium]
MLFYMVFALLSAQATDAMVGEPPAKRRRIDPEASSFCSSQAIDLTKEGDIIEYQCLQQNKPNAKSFNKNKRVPHALYCGYYALFFARAFIEETAELLPEVVNDLGRLRATIKPWEKHLKYKSNLRTDDFDGTCDDTESGLLNKFKLNEGIIVIDSLDVLEGWLRGRGQYLTREIIDQRKRFESGEKVAFVVNTGGHWVAFGVRAVDGMFNIFRFDSLKNLDLNQERAGRWLCLFLEKFTSEQLADMLLVGSRLAYIANHSENVRADLRTYFNAIQSKRPMSHERFIELVEPYGFARDVLSTLFELEKVAPASSFNFCGIL